MLSVFLAINIDLKAQDLELIEKYGSNSKWGFVDKTGKEIVPIKYETIEEAYQILVTPQPFSDFAKTYVEPKINEWQKKDEFEKQRLAVERYRNHFY